MPFTTDSPNLPDNIKSLPENKRAQWVNIWNSVFEKCQEDSGDDCESAASKQANGVVLSSNVLHFITNQIAESRRESLGGREFIVAPVVAIRAGVLKDELVPAEEIAKHSAAWDGRPFVLGHPINEDGVNISANDPQILTERSIGSLFNTSFDGEKLRGEVWVDIAKATAIGAEAIEVMRRLEDGKPLEVSTAYFRDRDENQVGTVDGKPFVAVARNLRPDHLAALIDEIGACSWEDGCGVPRVNQEETVVEKEPNRILKAVNALMELIKSVVSNQEVIVSKEEAIALIVKDGRLGLNAEDMGPLSEGAIANLVAHLRAMDVAAAPPEKQPDEEPKTEEPVTQQADPKPAANTADCIPPELQALAEKAKAVGGIQAAIKQIDTLIANAAKERETLISGLTANAACAFSKEALKEMSLGQLETLLKSLQPQDFSAQAAPAVSNSKEQTVTLPSLF